MSRDGCRIDRCMSNSNFRHHRPDWGAQDEGCKGAESCTVVAAFMVIVSNSSVLAGEACPAGALGVSRIFEVETTGGPWYGEPHGDPNFLAPGEVVLTFDDGPSPSDTREIIAALAKECTKATFFIVGEMVALYPEIVKEVADQGHTIGTHTWSHRNLARLSLPESPVRSKRRSMLCKKPAPHPSRRFSVIHISAAASWRSTISRAAISDSLRSISILPIGACAVPRRRHKGHGGSQGEGPRHHLDA